MSDETKKTFPKLLKRTVGGGTQEWEIWVEQLPNGHGRIHTRYGLADGKKQETQDVVEKGKNPGKKNATTPWQQACAEAQSQWDEKLSRKGYGLTVDASAATRSVSPMLAHKWKDYAKRIKWGEQVHMAQPKLDGYRCLAENVGERIVLKSRENQPIETVAHIAEALLSFLPPGHILDGELYCHGMKFKDHASGIKKVGEHTPKIVYHVYDVLQEEPYPVRHLFLKHTLPDAPDGPVRLVETRVLTGGEEELMRLQAHFIDEGFEGAMLRVGGVPYEAGKRSPSLLKVKTFDDAEFEVTGFKEGRGSHKGMAVFQCVTEAGHPFDATAPGTHEEKRAFLAEAAKYVGKKLTVKYQGFTDTAKPVPRFPTALRFREDL